MAPINTKLAADRAKHLLLVLVAAALALFLGTTNHRLSSTFHTIVVPATNDYYYTRNDERSMPMPSYLITNSTRHVRQQLRAAALHDKDKPQQDKRRLGLISQCPKQRNSRPPPQLPPLPTLQQSTYAVSFPGSGDKMITKYLVESMTGLYVGEASFSPSLAKMKALGMVHNDNNGKDGGKKKKKKQGGGGGEGDSSLGRGQGEVVALRTQFPHTSGKLASWDEDVPRAFVILRNPLHAIPCYFNRLYEMNEHLPTGSSTLPENAAKTRAAWIKWRDNQLHSQTMLYRRFVSFWMEKFLGNEGARLYFSYERFIDEETGPQEAARLATFLDEGIKANAIEWVMSSMENHKAEEDDGEPQPLDAFLKKGMSPEETIDVAVDISSKTMVDLEDVPCLWKDVVYDTVSKHRASAEMQQQQQSGGKRHHRNLQEEKVEETMNDHFGFDGGDWMPSERPYTPEDLAALSQMLLELMNRWSRHQRLLSILSIYHREVNRAYLASVGKLDEAIAERDRLEKTPNPDLRNPGEADNDNNADQKLQETQQQQSPPAASKEPLPPPSMLPFHIIQASPQNTGSAVVTNWLIGLFEPNKDVAFMEGWPESPIQQSGRDTTIDSTIVTKTNNLDLLTMYKLTRPHFEEVFFVVSNRGADPHTRLSDDLCSYKNVLCLEYEELQYTNDETCIQMVRSLTDKFRKRFEFYFGLDANAAWLRMENEQNAVERLVLMARRKAEMRNEPRDHMDLRFGVHGGGAPAGKQKSEVAGDAAAAADSTMPENRNRDRQRHRRLSIALPNGGCEVTWPQPPKMRIQTSYAASYPGCGARMSWNLIEALTGLWTGDDWDNNNRGKRVVTVKTHYPHDAGKLVSWDDEINRALVIIRNPMNAIPSFFNHIYEIKNNLKIHSQRAPVSDWIEWRDRLAMGQVRKYAKFVDYWMERFDRLNDDRIFISYETLTDDNDGPEEAIRINNFLAQSEGVDPINTESVPCIWRAVVKYKGEITDTQKQQGRRLLLDEDGRRRRLDPEHHDSQRSGPTERPYTPAMLEEMSHMLLDLIQRWGDRHLRLRHILEGYQKDVHAAYLASTAQQSPHQANDGSQEQSGRSFHIFQASLSNTGASVLNNVLVGLFDPDAEYKKSSLVEKTHEVDLLNLYKNERPKYEEIFFVGTGISSEICEYNNVMCFKDDELQYNNQQELGMMVNNLGNKIQDRFQYFLGTGFLDERKKLNAVKRLQAMDSAIASVKDTPLSASEQSVNSGNEIARRFEVNGKSFHIFQVSPPNTHTGATVATNWLMGLFEPERDYSFMINNRGQTVRQHDMNVKIDSTLVTKTHILDLMALYKQYRPVFDEIFFVVSNRGTSPETRIDASFCEYDNVLCLEYEDLAFSGSDEKEIEKVVNRLTIKFRTRFEYFFGANSEFLSEDKVASSVQRLKGMALVGASLANQPYSVSDPKYGVHGGHNREAAVSSFKGKLFYCGGAQGHLQGRKNFSYSTFGLFLANSLFPDFDGRIEIQSDNKVVNSATPLTEDTMRGATVDDLLIMHSHQHCEVATEEFPGIQLHINAEYYDLHPKHLDNIDGKLTLDFLPPGGKSYVIGPHQDSSRSIRVPFCSMRLWYLHMTGQSNLNKIFDAQYKPKNTRQNFLLYINSHYIEYREQAARLLSEISTIHTAGKCQGYYEAHPPPPVDDSATQCVPFDDSERPPSIQPISGQSGVDNQRNNMELFSKYRYALVMENVDVPGYVSEKILHAFLSGTVPIYYGSRFVFEIFNPKAFIYFDLDVPHQALTQIQYYEQNPVEYEKMLNEPILANGQETIEKYFSWDSSLKSRIRHMMKLELV